MNENFIELRKMFKNSKWTKVILIVAAVVILAVAADRIYLQILELEEIGGLSSIYIKNMLWKIGIGTVAGLIAFGAVLVQNIFIIKNLKKYFIKNDKVPGKFYNWIPAAVAGLIFAITANSSMYLNAMKYFNGNSFGIADPLFSNDVGYYLFSRPFLMNVVNYFQGLVIFLIVYAVVYYIVGMLMIFANLR
ncbi:MAG: UPF0182 family protein, partial [Clostridiales bacterium]|nr:UPF0182 family protein [Clostridiales bacterium]